MAAEQSPLGSTFIPREGTGEARARLEAPPGKISEVSKVWGRWSEWKKPALWAAASITLAVLIQFAPSLVGILIVLAGVGCALYQVAITMDRPVRVTAEHAASEYYPALGHRFPNFERMYAVLTADGKRCQLFSDLAGFRAYWKARLRHISPRPLWLRPLDVRVTDFSGTYDAGKSVATARYRIQVFRHGKSEPISEFEIQNTMVRGPDGMWYLNDGLLPAPQPGP